MDQSKWPHKLANRKKKNIQKASIHRVFSLPTTKPERLSSTDCIRYLNDPNGTHVEGTASW
jgi:hypothetical protein